MAIDLTKFNVVPTYDAREAAQAKAQEMQMESQRKLSQLGLSQNQLDYLQTHGISSDKFQEMQNIGYSKETIFYLAESGKAGVNLSDAGIRALNELASGKTLNFSAGFLCN